MKRIINWKITLFLFLTGCFTSCKDTIYEPARTYELVVSKVDRDTTFVIINRNQSAFFRFSFEGYLSHRAAVHWSTDSSFTVFTGILVPAGKVSMPEDGSDHYNDNVYVKYRALNDSTSGELRIKVRF